MEEKNIMKRRLFNLLLMLSMVMVLLLAGVTVVKAETAHGLHVFKEDGTAADEGIDYNWIDDGDYQQLVLKTDDLVIKGSGSKEHILVDSEVSKLTIDNVTMEAEGFRNKNAIDFVGDLETLCVKGDCTINGFDKGLNIESETPSDPKQEGKTLIVTGEKNSTLTMNCDVPIFANYCNLVIEGDVDIKANSFNGSLVIRARNITVKDNVSLSATTESTTAILANYGTFTLTDHASLYTCPFKSTGTGVAADGIHIGGNATFTAMSSAMYTSLNGIVIDGNATVTVNRGESSVYGISTPYFSLGEGARVEVNLDQYSVTESNAIFCGSDVDQCNGTVDIRGRLKINAVEGGAGCGLRASDCIISENAEVSIIGDCLTEGIRADHISFTGHAGIYSEAPIVSNEEIAIAEYANLDVVSKVAGHNGVKCYGNMLISTLGDVHIVSEKAEGLICENELKIAGTLGKVSIRGLADENYRGAVWFADDKLVKADNIKVTGSTVTLISDVSVIAPAEFGKDPTEGYGFFMGDEVAQTVVFQPRNISDAMKDEITDVKESVDNLVKEYEGREIELVQLLARGYDLTVRAVMNGASTAKLNWNKAGIASGYEVYGMNAQGNWQKLGIAEKNTFTTRVCAKYRVRMIVKYGGKDIYGTYSEPAKLILAKTYISSLKSKSKKRVTLKLKKVTGAQSYQIKYKVAGKKWKTTSTKSLTRTIKKLTSKKMVSVKARAVRTVGNAKVYGAWSAVKKAKVK